MRNSWALTVLSFTATFAAPAATFYKDVLPVLQRSCQGCHRPGEAAPMSFLTYESTRPWAAAIREVVRTRKMPPWSADAPHGVFANDPSLTQNEIDLISDWVQAKAPAGNPSDGPKPLTFVEGWAVGDPDIVFRMPKPYRVPAAGTVEYTYVVIPTGFQEDRWVRLAEVRPGSRSVVHHVIAWQREAGSVWMKDARPGEPYVPVKSATDPSNSRGRGEYIAGYVPGRQPASLALGQARLLKAGADIVLQLHYTPNGKSTDDQTSVGLIFSKEAPKQRVVTRGISAYGLVIPPNTDNHAVTSSLTFRDEAEIVAMWPHMHLRGKTFRYDVTQPGKERQNVLNVPKYDFNWQHRYVPSKPLNIHAGAVVDCSATFDNSKNNKFNPDPNAEVYWGDQTWEEMMIGWVDVAFDASKTPEQVFGAPVVRPAVAAR
jgi:hypothetical protein